MEILTSAEAKFNDFKRQIEKNKMFSTEVLLTDIKIVSDEFIEIGGITMPMEKSAFKDLVHILGLNKKVLKSFENHLSEKAKHALLNAMQKGIASGGNKSVHLYASKDKTILKMSTNSKPGLTDQSYIDMVERVLNENPGFEINSYAVDHYGAHLNMINNNPIGIIPGIEDETFNFGLSMDNDFRIGTAVSPFNERLICSNGMVTRTGVSEQLVVGKPGTFALKDLTSETWNSFHEHMNSLEKNHYIAPGFIGNVKRAMETHASVSELEHARSMFPRSVGKDVELWLPYENIKAKYGASGIDLDTVSNDSKATAHTNQTVWDVVNAVTNFASHNSNFETSDKQRQNLKQYAGDLLIKGTYDIDKIINVNPFSEN